MGPCLWTAKTPGPAGSAGHIPAMVPGTLVRASVGPQMEFYRIPCPISRGPDAKRVGGKSHNGVVVEVPRPVQNLPARPSPPFQAGPRRGQVAPSQIPVPGKSRAAWCPCGGCFRIAHTVRPRAETRRVSRQRGRESSVIQTMTLDPVVFSLVFPAPGAEGVAPRRHASRAPRVRSVLMAASVGVEEPTGTRRREHRRPVRLDRQASPVRPRQPPAFSPRAGGVSLAMTARGLPPDAPR
jgi:hypothetical protein